MIIIVIYAVISFLFDGLSSLFITSNIYSPSIFSTIYTVISLVIIYNYFDNDNKYLKILITLGILFDIVYTNTFLLNVFIFIIIYMVMKVLNDYIPNNLFMINIKSSIAIVTYHLLSYMILFIVHYDKYYVKELFLIISRSIVMTVIYTSVSYLIIKKIYFKKYVKKIK